MSVSKRFIYFLSVMQICSSCNYSREKGSIGGLFPFAEPMIDVPDGKLTPEVIWQMGSVGTPSLSADGRNMVFTIAYSNIKEDKTAVQIFASPTDRKGQIVQITGNLKGISATDPAFLPDGSIAFLKTCKSVDALKKRVETPQLFVCGRNGTKPVRATAGGQAVDAFLFSPDAKHVVLVRSVCLDKDAHGLYEDLPKSNVYVETDLMYRHWNSWSDGSYSHIFIGKWDGKSVSEEVDIMEGERFHSPLRPFGGIEQLSWSADGTKLAYTCKKLSGIASAVSTNSDIYVYDLSTRETTNVSSPNAGYDTNPVFVSDDTLLWLSMERDGYESDRNRIMRKDLKTGYLQDLTEGSELYVQQFVVADNCNDVWFIANEMGCDAIFHLDVQTKEITKLTNDVADYTSLAIAANGKLIATRTSMFAPPDIFCVDVATGKASNLTNANAKTLLKIKMGSVQQRWLTTTDGKKMHTWVVLPPDFDDKKEYPALLYCQGGPQSTVSQFWSRRWNFALMASNDYIVVAPNRRGLPGFGVEWNEQISKDYGGQNMKDYFVAIDSLSAEPYIDSNRLGCVGASYGGFSVYWLAGHHQKRFKAFISHCGIFNFEQQYSTTEELFFVNWDFGGPYWDKSNVAAQNSYAQSPHLFVDNWDTPIMVIHGENDFRIPYTQGMAAFNVAKMKGLEAKMLVFPDECHWVSHPQNSILWHREFYKWLDRWLK